MVPYRRNVLVGITVIVALITLGWMILQFGGGMVTPFAPKQIPVSFTSARADGISDGSAVLYRGIEAGRILRTRLSEDRKGVIISAMINEVPALPANVHGEIRNLSVLGSGAAIILDVDGEPTGTLTSGQTIETKFVGFQFLPPEFGDLAVELKRTTQQFRESNVVGDIDAEVKRAGQLTESLRKLIDDPKMRADLDQTMTNVRTATETANRVATKLDKISDDATATIGEARTTIAKSQEQVTSIGQQVSARLDQTGKLLEQFNAIAGKIDHGDGTAGKLVNDPRLYESLADTSAQLNATVKDLKRLIEQWEQEGVSLKLK